MRKSIFLFFLMTTLLVSCSLSKFGWRVDNDSKSVSPEERGIVEDWDPLSLKNEEAPAAPVDAAATIPAAAPGTSPSKTPVSSATLDGEGEGQVPGFRVQLLSSSSETAAYEEKRKAMLRFNEKVYLVFDAQYKVRLGDFVTREEAKPLRNLAVEKGYADAFIVRSNVNKPEQAASPR